MYAPGDVEVEPSPAGSGRTSTGLSDQPVRISANRSALANSARLTELARPTELVGTPAPRISHRLLIDEFYAGPLRDDWLGDLRAGSLLILDEAHHAAPSSGARYAIDSKITHAVRELAPRFEHRLFLSATPHRETARP